jgi:hypothetical protein
MIYAFDEADDALTLLPMASRRALDAAGLKLSLASYQTLGLADRKELVRLGAEPKVDVSAVQAIVARAGGPPSQALPPVIEPDAMPEGLSQALQLHDRHWQELTALDRYVLDKLHRGGKSDRLHAALAEMMARG